MDPAPDIWTIRHAIYRHFAGTSRAPGVDEITASCGVSRSHVEKALLELDSAHALFLDPGTYDIRIANPFSGVRTDFRAIVGGQTYWANCAWDCYGVIAALGSSDGTIEAVCTENGSQLQLAVRDGEAVDGGAVVHFLVPFAAWYDDLVHT
jgi:hypothetical protein